MSEEKIIVFIISIDEDETGNYEWFYLWRDKGQTREELLEKAKQEYLDDLEIELEDSQLRVDVTYV